MKLRVGDSVLVLVGKDKGKEGEITKILPSEGQVIVTGMNKKIRHIKKREGQAGDRIEIFAPIDISNVSLKDPSDNKPTRVRYEDQEGQKVRVSARSGKPIQNPKKSDKKVSIKA